MIFILGTRRSSPSVHIPLFVLILVNGKRQWERALAQIVTIYSELCAFANLILSSVLYSVEMPNVIIEEELRHGEGIYSLTLLGRVYEIVVFQARHLVGFQGGLRVHYQ